MRPDVERMLIEGRLRITPEIELRCVTEINRYGYELASANVKSRDLKETARERDPWVT